MQMDRLIIHYGKYNSLDENTVEKILTSSIEDNFGLDDADMQKLHGVGGKVIKARTVNQARLVESIRQMIWSLLLVLLVQERHMQSLPMAVKALKTKKSNELFNTSSC